MNDGLGLIVARALLYGGVLMAFGLPAYLVCAPACVRLWLAERRGTWLCVAMAGAIGMAATALHLLLLAATMNGVSAGQVDRDMLDFVATGMPVGRAALVRGGALIGLVAVALLLRRRARTVACVAIGAVAVATLPWNGHAMINEGMTGRMHVAADQIHLLAAGLWIGAVAALLRLATAARAVRTALCVKAFAGFAHVGTLLVATLILTGIVNTLMIIDLRGLDLSQPFPALLAFKILLFVAALGLAANNRYRLTPRLSTGPEAEARSALARSAGIELVLLISIVAVVAILGTMSPAA